MSAIAAEGLTVEFGGTRVLGPLDLALEPGSWTVVIGPNGAGKSTLLRALCGLVAFGGAVLLHDARAGSARRELARHVAFLPQRPTLPNGMRVSDYVLLGRSPHVGLLAAEQPADLEATGRVLDRLDLRRFADRPLDELSGGEAQRVVLARALAQDAPVLLLDEPTASLDLGQAQHVLELVDELRAERTLTVLAAMHDLSLAALYADELLLLAGGRIVVGGHPDVVLDETAIALHYGAAVALGHAAGGRPSVVPVRRPPP